MRSWVLVGSWVWKGTQSFSEANLQLSKVVLTQKKGGNFFGICKIFFKFLTHFLLESFYLCISSFLQTAVKFIHTQSKHFVIWYASIQQLRIDFIVTAWNLINIVAKILELTLFSVMSWPLMPSPRSSSSRRSSTPEMADEQDWEGSIYFSNYLNNLSHTENWRLKTEYWKSQDLGYLMYFYNYHNYCQNNIAHCTRYSIIFIIYLDSWSSVGKFKVFSIISGSDWSSSHLSKGVGFWARSCEAWSVRHRVLKKKKLIINLFQWNIRLDLSDLVVILFHVLIWQNIFSYLYTYILYFKDL